MWAKYALPFNLLPGQLDVGAGAFLVDKRQGDDANSFQVPGYVRADVFAHYRYQQVDVQFNVENVLDKRYVSSSNFDDTVIQGNRLLFRVMVAMQFGTI